MNKNAEANVIAHNDGIDEDQDWSDTVVRINAIKREFHLSNAQLARLCGISKQAVGGWLNENKSPGIEVALKIEAKLGVNVAWIRHGVGPMLNSLPTPDAMRVALQGQFSKMSNDERKAASLELIKLCSKYI